MGVTVCSQRTVGGAQYARSPQISYQRQRIGPKADKSDALPNGITWGTITTCEQSIGLTDIANHSQSGALS